MQKYASYETKSMTGAGSLRAALHVIDEGAQFRHHLPLARMIEEHAGSHRRVGFEHLNELSGRDRLACDRRGDLGEANALERRAKDGRIVVSDQRPPYAD